ncbi:single-stranded DNA-binding protein, partial [Streptomyces sp. SID11233]|nr:single-stranded DNA-binding protein [Streptomyces sp. SID11233]
MPIGETIITVVGNLTADPELRHTTDGTPWVTFNVASNSKNWDKQRAEWGEGHTLFLRCTAWRWLAQNAEATLTKGTR